MIIYKKKYLFLKKYNNNQEEAYMNLLMQTKLAKMPIDAQVKLQETLERIVNEGSGGLISCPPKL